MKNFKWDKKYLYWGVTAFLVVVASISFFWFLNRWDAVRAVLKKTGDALAPFTWGILIAYLLNKIMSPIERRVLLPAAGKVVKNQDKARKLARVFAIIATDIIAIGVFVGLLASILPQIYLSVSDLIGKSQGYINSAAAWAQSFFSDGVFGMELGSIGEKVEQLLVTAGDRLVGWLEDDVIPQLGGLLASVTGGVITALGGLLNFLIGLIISVYLLYNKETFCAQIKKVLTAFLRPRTVRTLVRETAFINDAFGDYIVGTLIDALIVGLVTYVFMLAVGMPYTALVAILIGVTNIIPLFGPFIGAVPAALLLLLERPLWCLIFVVFILVLQQLDGHVIKPRIHSSKSGISGLWIIFAIIFFGGLFGLVGMLLGVPVTTVLYSIFRRYNNHRLRNKGYPVGTDFYKDIRYIDPETNEPVYKPGHAPEEPSATDETAPEKAAPDEAADDAKSGGAPDGPGEG